MKKLSNFRFLSLTILLTLAVLLTACGGDSAEEAAENNEKPPLKDGVELGDTEIELPYVAWASALASTHVMQALLEDVGYDVTTTQVGKGAMFTSMADGSADANTCTWLPHNSKNLWDEYKDDVVKMNKTIEEAPVGLAVPTYMEIDSIEDLKDNEELGEATDWQLTGIEAGSGQMDLTREVMEEYELDNWELLPSSGSGMVTALGDAIENEEPIIVTLWKPHFAFGQWDLKFLEDPKKIHGEFDSIWTVAREGLDEDSPAAYQVLKQFEWTEELMNEVMVNIEDGMEPEDAGKQFIEDHPDLVEKWTEGVR